jgi:hypothetical protein
MARKYSIDLSEELPTLEVKVPGGTITLSLQDVYEYGMIGMESGATLKARAPKITAKFNEDNGCNLSAEQVYLLIFKGCSLVDELMGNSDGSPT